MTELSERLATLSPAKRALLQKLRGAPPIPRAPDGPAPLSAEQRRLWYVLQLAPGYPVYTIPLGFRLRGALRVDALLDALRELVARHEMLRAAFVEQGGAPVQVVHDGSAFQPRTVEVPDDQWAASEARWQADEFARAGFDLGAGETFRATLVRVAKDEHHLLMGLHHLAADGGSAGVLLRELGALYAARTGGERAHLPPPAVRFRDWAAFQRQPREGAEADEAFWRAELAGAPHVLDLPMDHPRAAAQSWEGFKHPFPIAPELAGALEAAARAEGTTLYVIFAAAYALLLSRYAGQEDFLLGTLLANRPRPELAEVVGFFANTVPLRMRMHGDPTVSELIRRVHGTLADAHRHGALPFDRIVELADLRRDFSRPPLVQAVLTFGGGPASPLDLRGVEVERIEMDSRTAIFDLVLQVERHGDALAAALQAPEALLDEATVRRMARHLTTILAAIAGDRARPVSRIALADGEEVAQVAAWSDGGPALLEEGVIHHLFQAQARETPDAVALVHGHAEVTFDELNRRANRIAHGLIAAGVERGECVGVCLARTPALVAAMLGILKSGAAYVPMDPAHPAPRHRAALALSAARRVITDAASRAALGELPGSVAAATVAELEAEGEDDPAPRAGPGDLAYVIFTSGSTGGPKGVAIEHRATAAMLAWVRELLGEERSAVLGATPVTFDVSVAELFGTLCCGGTVVLVENALAGLPRGRRVLAAPMTPTAAAELLREGRLPAGAQTLLLGGEAVPPPLVGALAESGVPRIVNLWGPTEDTTYSTWAVLEPGDDRVGVGRPIPGGRVYVLDAHLRHAGIGEPGEVWTAGAGVARGYAARPALTAQKFVPDPYGPPGSRMYRTLDRGRWREDGTLEYLGRMDAQVKVRGHRIELEEVEQALAAHPAVAHAAVAARGDGGAGARLAGYLVARTGAEAPGGTELRAFLRERLPEYMVPAAFAWTDALPRTGSGKLDRRALPPVDAGPDGAEFVAPRPGLEARIAAVWQDVLGVDRVGAHDDFFDLGGQSILATRLVARLQGELGIQVPIGMLMQAPTVEALARAVEAGARSVRLPLVPLQTFGDRPPLFLAHPAGGHVICYRGLAVNLAPDQPVYGLQPRGLEDGAEPIDDLGEMAAYYVDAIRRFRPRGPYRLGGWSFGGVVAWEMARQLRAAGEEVDLLAMLDTSPLTDEAIEADPRDAAEVMMQTIGGYAGWAAAERITVDAVRHLSPREMALAMIGQVGDARLLPESRADLILSLTRVRSANLRAQAAYALRPYDGHLTYFRTEGSAEAPLQASADTFWGSRAAGVTVIPVTGNHGTILHEPHVYPVVRGILDRGG
ncbi:MAG: amino acid adenylation domain-containing protein [Gemmatimonadetes bacterium]|nr:amino acid adenylation domain-containing protein [Gemmatimonadota bacterium]